MDKDDEFFGGTLSLNRPPYLDPRRRRAPTALLQSRILHAVVSGAFGLAVFAVLVTGWWASTYMLPVSNVKNAVRAKLADPDSARFEHVWFSKETRIGCGYVSEKKATGGYEGTRHFIVFPDGSLQFEPAADVQQGDTSQRIAMLQRQVSYAALIKANCLR